MKNLLIIIFTMLIVGCASKFSSMKQVRSQEPMHTEVISTSFDNAYANLSAAITECFIIDIYKTYSVKRRGTAEVSVLSAQMVSGANIWLFIMLEPHNTNETKLNISWGNEAWKRHANLVPNWAKGEVPDC